MDQTLRAPRNRTAELQLIQRLVSQGYTLWTADQIPLGKLPGFVEKWGRYRLLADPAARAYRKRSGRANSHLVLEHRYNELDATEGVRVLVVLVDAGHARSGWSRGCASSPRPCAGCKPAGPAHSMDGV